MFKVKSSIYFRCWSPSSFFFFQDFLQFISCHVMSCQMNFKNCHVLSFLIYLSYEVCQRISGHCLKCHVNVPYCRCFAEHLNLRSAITVVFEPLSSIMSELNDNSLNINFLKESVLKRLCESLDKANNKGWRKLGEIVKSDRRFKVR